MAPFRPVAFILASTDHGMMIINRNDHHTDDTGKTFGVGYELLQFSSFTSQEVNSLLQMFTLRRQQFGDGVVAIDGGANIGVHTIEWARHMTGWGHVLSFEAQEVVYYALAGNIVINNCLNVHAKLAALGDEVGELIIPRPDYFKPSTFGSLEIKPQQLHEYIGQPISYDTSTGVAVPLVSIDSLNLQRVDFIKLDIEGMEVEALKGAKKTIQAHRPILFVEIIKSDVEQIVSFFNQIDYLCLKDQMNIFAIHKDDPIWPHVAYNGNSATNS
ncbi:putative cytosolic protein [Granulibacter bethesdensis]|uniref:FkbM family methyltransferase n=1 Tax=Granulibacter bethesdensis TaxID=364410 RepID=UPI00090C04D2|nr:FkbM family methyltransferase [Granulibacter bethesdensis]APH57005.1 putative cytosolic protein [Granulibacter bethesdensis]